MGTNVYSHGFIKDDPLAYRAMLNGPEPQRLLHDTGEEFIVLCKQIYEVESKHDAEDLTPHYGNSFSLTETSRRLIRAIRVYNTDVTAEWVEYGSHAGGKTRILGYRIMGRAADILEARVL